MGEYLEFNEGVMDNFLFTGPETPGVFRVWFERMGTESKEKSSHNIR